VRQNFHADVTVLIGLCGICGRCVQEFFEGYGEGGSVGIVADDVIRVPCIWWRVDRRKFFEKFNAWEGSVEVRSISKI
jgi:hypothetical protein